MHGCKGRQKGLKESVKRGGGKYDVAQLGALRRGGGSVIGCSGGKSTPVVSQGPLIINACLRLWTQDKVVLLMIV